MKKPRSPEHQTDAQVGESKPRLARIYLSEDLLREWLPIPEAARILGSRGHEGEVEIVISAPEFPELEPGDELPIVAPRFETRDGRSVFVEWGGL